MIGDIFEVIGNTSHFVEPPKEGGTVGPGEGIFQSVNTDCSFLLVFYCKVSNSEVFGA